MGLITGTVIAKWNPANRKWYEEKGYIFTKNKDEFEAKVEDLTNGSNILINIKCDCKDCKNPYLKPMKYSNYIKYVKEDGKYYCNKCAMKLYGTENYRKGKLKNGKSFAQWCIENNRQDILDRFDYELNDYKPNEIGYGTKKKCYFKCPKGVHKSELKDINNFTNGHLGVIDCRMCNSFAQWGIDNIGIDFLGKYWNYDKNTVNPWMIAKGFKKTIWIKCQEKDYHGSYNVTCESFIIGNRCSYCTNRNGKVHFLDSLGTLYPQVLEVWSSKNKKSPYEYSPHSSQEVWWKCVDDTHKDYTRSIGSSNNYNFRCPECTREKEESFLQEKVRLYLESFEYTILHERNCTIIPKNPKTNMPLPFDNEVKELNLIIEVHGIQHYEISSWHKSLAEKHNTTPKQELHYQKLKDRYKRIFAKKQGFFYLEIPFWTDDKKETWKKLIDDKIKEIMNRPI